MNEPRLKDNQIPKFHKIKTISPTKRHELLTNHCHADPTVNDRHRLVRLVRRKPDEELRLRIELALVPQALVPNLFQCLHKIKRTRTNQQLSFTEVHQQIINKSLGQIARYFGSNCKTRERQRGGRWIEEKWNQLEGN